jgi:hypothetical protein
MHHRTLRVLAAGLMAAGADAARTPAAAQQPDSAARRDSALAERERRRIRGERVRTTSPRVADSARAPGSRGASWRAELGAAFGTRYLEDPSGVKVASQVLPMVGGGVAWTTGERTAVAITARLSGGPLRISSGGGDDWSGGTVMHGDLLGTVEWVVHPRATVHAGVGAAWLRGPSDLAPFRFNNGTPVHAGGVVGASARLLRARPLDLIFDLQAVRYGGGSAGDPIPEPGTVTRYVLGVRYGA